MNDKRKLPRARHTESLTLGLVGFAKISAVEGIALDADAERLFQEFDRQGLGTEERRRAIVERHSLKS